MAALKAPGWFQFPNELFEKEYQGLSNPAFRVFAFICRKTIGWHKIADTVSDSQMREATGLAKTTIIRAIEELLKADLIKIDRQQGKTTEYTVNLSTGIATLLVSNQSDTSTGSVAIQTKETPKETIQKKNVSSIIGYTQAFDLVWAIYPRKVNKQGAWKCFRTRCREGERAEFLMACTEEYVKQKRGTEEKFIMHPSTFFGPDKRYLDYKPSAPAQKRSPPRKRREPEVINEKDHAAAAEFLGNLKENLRDAKRMPERARR